MLPLSKPNTSVWALSGILSAGSHKETLARDIRSRNKGIPSLPTNACQLRASACLKNKVNETSARTVVATLIGRMVLSLV